MKWRQARARYTDETGAFCDRPLHPRTNSSIVVQQLTGEPPQRKSLQYLERQMILRQRSLWRNHKQPQPEYGHAQEDKPARYRSE